MKIWRPAGYTHKRKCACCAWTYIVDVVHLSWIQVLRVAHYQTGVLDQELTLVNWAQENEEKRKTSWSHAIFEHYGELHSPTTGWHKLKHGNWRSSWLRHKKMVLFIHTHETVLNIWTVWNVLDEILNKTKDTLEVYRFVLDSGLWNLLLLLNSW
jgi:hypothetical protein